MLLAVLLALFNISDKALIESLSFVDFSVILPTHATCSALSLI